MRTTIRTNLRLSVAGPLALAALAATVSGQASGQASGQVSQQISVTTTSTPGGLVTRTVTDVTGMQGTAPKPMDLGTGVIVGRVVDDTTNAGVSGAIVTLTLPGAAPVRVQANGDGQFVFRSLPKGTFSLAASRPGYVDGAAGRTRPGGPTRGITLAEADRVGDVDIPMWKYAAIAGTVRDEHNEPLVGAQIRVLRRDFVGGRQRLTMGATDTTDDRGQYRIGSLEAGDYIVALPMIHRPSVNAMVREGLPMAGGGGGNVMIAVRMEATASSMGGGAPVIMSNLDGSVPPAGVDDDGRPLTYQTEFYTGALAAARATAVTLSHGEERVGLDFSLTPVRALSVSGVAIGPEGPMPNVQLQLVPAAADEIVSPIETATSTTDASGRFTFDMVPAGNYALRAQRQGAGGMVATFGSSVNVETIVVRQAIDGVAQLPSPPDVTTLWAEVPVGVATSDVDNLSVMLRPGLTVSGTITFQGSIPQPAAQQRSALAISLEPADGRTVGFASTVRGRVEPNGTFTTAGVPAGKYILRVAGAPQGWSLRDASYNGRDITSLPIELDGDNALNVSLTFTDRPTELSGVVRDASGNADARASVLIFPADPAAWLDTGSQPRRLRQVRANQDGTYKVGGLPPGEYQVIAVDDASTPPSWQDPAALAVLARAATSLRLTEGSSQTQALATMKGGR